MEERTAARREVAAQDVRKSTEMKVTHPGSADVIAARRLSTKKRNLVSSQRVQRLRRSATALLLLLLLQVVVLLLLVVVFVVIAVHVALSPRSGRLYLRSYTYL